MQIYITKHNKIFTVLKHLASRLLLVTVFICFNLPVFSQSKLNIEHCQSHRAENLQKLFTHRNARLAGWLGGDNANSIAVGENHYLWTFGDTLIGEHEPLTQARIMKSMIHDSFALMTIKKAKPSLNFFYKKNEKNDPISFFSSQNGYYWILSGTSLPTKKTPPSVVLGLAELKNTSSSFEIIANTLALIKNPTDPIEQWQTKLFSLTNTLPESLSKIHWISSLVVQNEYLYLFGTNLNASFSTPMYLARVKLSELINGKTLQFEFLSPPLAANTKPNWITHPSSLNDLKAIEGLPSSSEYSLYFDKALKRWLTLNIAPFSFKVNLFSAKKLEGPWQNEGTIYKIPPPFSTLKLNGASLFISYAAKIHQELNFKKNNAITFTFSYINNLNTFELPEAWTEKGELLLKTNPDFYSPLLIELTCPLVPFPFNFDR